MKGTDSIRFRFWIAMNTLILAGVLASGLLFFWSSNQYLEKSLRSEGITAINTLGSAIAFSMLKEEYGDISPLAYSMLDHSNVQYVIIRDLNGRVVNQKGEIFTDVPPLIEKVPLIYFNKVLGEIEIGLKTDTLENQRQDLLISTILMCIAVSILALIISTIASRKLISPLKRLLDATREMIQGKRDILVREEGPEEILELSRTFNQMAATIENHENILHIEIDKATKNLQERVNMLRAITEISESVIERDLLQNEVIGLVLNKLREFFLLDVISVSLWDQKELQNLYEYISKADCDRPILKETVNVQDSPAWEAILQKQVVIKQNLEEVTQLLPREKWMIEEGIRSIIMVPLVAKNKVIGTINAGSKDVDFFQDQHVADLQFYSHQMAILLDRAAAYESLKHSAFHDYLTGLPNHRQFKSLLERALENVRNQPGQMLGVLFLDLDRFKFINDTLGHDFGDVLLARVGERLTNALDDRYTVARLGGDEFTILLPQIQSTEEAVSVAEQIIQVMKEPYTINGYDAHLSSSIGVALYPTDGDDVETLIKHADTAMYRVKEQGKDNYAIFSPFTDHLSEKEFILENDLRKAIEQDQLIVYYQPKINIQSGEIAGLEALVRWIHPTRGLISPGEFIPLAEETGLIVPMGEIILRKACRQSLEWQKRLLPPIPISVNLSTRQFLQSNLVGIIAQILEETGIDSLLVELEITESMTMDEARAIAILADLKKLGVRISIDDFGTGYSSLNYLRKLPIDCLKIDRSFIQDIEISPNSAAIVSTIITMAHNLNLNVIAEGVEDERQARFLQEQQCDEVQGFYFSKPLSTEEFEQTFPELLQRASKWKSG